MQSLKHSTSEAFHNEQACETCHGSKNDVITTKKVNFQNQVTASQSLYLKIPMLTEQDLSKIFHNMVEMMMDKEL